MRALSFSARGVGITINIRSRPDTQANTFLFEGCMVEVRKDRVFWRGCRVQGFSCGWELQNLCCLLTLRLHVAI